MMGRFCFLRALYLFTLLLQLLILLLSFSHSHGHGFALKVMDTFKSADSSVHQEGLDLRVIGGGESRREMIEVLDYQLEPGPNTNPKSGFVYGPPPHA